MTFAPNKRGSRSRGPPETTRHSLDTDRRLRPHVAVEAGRWPTPELLAGAEELEDYGGFPPGFFVTLAGKTMPFRGPAYESPPALAERDGWSVLPAFAGGQPAAYVVSEVWASHPDPWIQPLYIPVTKLNPPQAQLIGGKPPPNTVGVGVQSTFYSPYWEAIFSTTREPVPAEGLPDVRAVLAAATDSVELGIKPLCPLTPFPFGFAATSQGPSRPLSGAAIPPRFAVPTRVDGATSAYVDFGPDRYRAKPGGAVIPTRIFFFTRLVAGAPSLLEIPAILSEDAVRSAYARRFDIDLSDSAVFVPAGSKWDEVRARLGAPAADPGIDPVLAATFALRVAKTSSCFGAASDFPAGCEWLDSEAAIDRLEPRRVRRTDKTMTTVPVLFEGTLP